MYKRQNNELSFLEQKILKLLEKEERPIPLFILIKKVNHPSKNAVISAIDYLKSRNLIDVLHNGKIVLGYWNGPIIKNKKYKGTITLNSKGDGFFKLEGEKERFAYINKINLNSALDGDTVEINLMDKKPLYDDLKDAIVVNVIDRNRDFFTGTYYCEYESENNKIEKVIPDDKKINLKIVLDDSENLVNGNKVLFKIGNITNDTIYCSISKILGHIDDVGNDIISIVYDNGIEPEFSKEVENEVEKIDFNFSAEEDARRKDLSKLNFVTIDPIGSKDMDDAVCVYKNNDDSYKLYVAIADVSYYVKLHSCLWSSAIKRGTSVYLVNQVIPMLPHKLSNDICSLNPYEKRYAQICEMDIDKNGDFININVYPGIINSKHKFAYDDVNEYIDKKTKQNSVSNELYDMLEISFELDSYLNSKRTKNGYIDFEIMEPKIILNDKGEIDDIVVRKTGKAQKMIENFMVAANEAVTLKFNELNPNTPFVYRVHDKPEERKINAFKIEAKKIGFRFDESLVNWEQNTVNKWLQNNKDNPNKELINMILLRTMAKAKYQTYNIGHFGLSIFNYTHFTSPIRRLADVIVHYLLRMFVFDKDRYTDSDRNYILDSLDDFCERANTTEVLAVETERGVNEMKFAEFMESKIGYEFNGFVSHVTSFGFFVQLENTIEGLVRPANMKDDFFAFNEENMTFVGRKSKRIISLGQKVKVRVVGASKESRKIDFEVVEYL